MNAKKPGLIFSTADLRKNLGDIIARAHYQGQIVDISNHGKLCAAIVSQEDAEFIKMKKQGGMVVSREDAELIETLKEVSGGHFKELRKRINKIVEEGKGLNEVVDELERTTSRVADQSSNPPLAGGTSDPTPPATSDTRQALHDQAA